MKRILATLICAALLLALGAPALAAYKLADGGEVGDGLICFLDKDTKKYGYMDTRGNIVIAPQYAIADTFGDGTAVVSVKNPPEYFLINRQNEVVMRAPSAKGREYELETPLINGATTALIWKKSKTGMEKLGYVLIDGNGRVLTPESLMYVSAFDENGLALVGEGAMPKKNATSNISGYTCFITAPKGNQNALAANRFYFIDRSGKQVGGAFEYARCFREGLAAVKVRKLNGAEGWGFIDQTGSQVVDAIYDEVGDFSGGLATVTINGKLGYVDRTGSVVVEPQYDGAGSFSEGLAWVRTGQDDDARYGYVDTAGKLVIGQNYTKAGSFKNGRASVSEGILAGIIDTGGRWVIQPGYASIAELGGSGLFRAKRSPSPYVANEAGRYINIVANGKTYPEGTEVMKIVFPVGDTQMVNFADESGEFVCVNSFNTDIEGERFTIVGGSDLYGVIDAEGREVAPAEYEYLSESADDSGIILAKKDGLYGYLNADGSVLVQPVYDKALRFDGVGIAWKGEAWEIFQPDGSRVDLEARAQAMREYTDRETVKAAQAALNEAGYDCGTPDGAAGKNTRAAILAYQADHDLAQTGKVNGELLEALGLKQGGA